MSPNTNAWMQREPYVVAPKQTLSERLNGIERNDRILPQSCYRARPWPDASDVPSALPLRLRAARDHHGCGDHLGSLGDVELRSIQVSLRIRGRGGFCLAGRQMPEDDAAAGLYRLSRRARRALAGLLDRCCHQVSLRCAAGGGSITSLSFRVEDI